MSKRSIYFNTAEEARLYFPDGVPSNVIAIVGDGSQVLVSSDNTANQQYFSADLTNDDIVSEMVQTSYTEGQTAGYDMGYAAGVASVPTPTGNINITTTSQYDVTAYATAQVVDANLISDNIVSGTTILGVTGTYEGESGIVPTGNINITTTSQYDVTSYATAQVVDANLVAENIVSGTTILGVTGTYTGSGGGSGIAEEDYYGLATRYAKPEFVNGVKYKIEQAVDYETADAIMAANDMIYTNINDQNLPAILERSIKNVLMADPDPIYDDPQNGNSGGQIIIQQLDGDRIVDISSSGSITSEQGVTDDGEYTWRGNLPGGTIIGLGLVNGEGYYERHMGDDPDIPSGMAWDDENGEFYSPNEEWEFSDEDNLWHNVDTDETWSEEYYVSTICPVFFTTNENYTKDGQTVYYNHWLKVPDEEEYYDVTIGWTLVYDSESQQIESIGEFVFDCSVSV